MASEATILIQNNGHSLTLPTIAFQGLNSTLCKGCGHNSITSYLIEACKAVAVESRSGKIVSGCTRTPP